MSTDASAQAERPSDRAPQRRNLLRALFSRLGRHEGPRERPHQLTGPPDSPVDLVDQAEAFQDVRVEEVMTPRADIVAVEFASPLSEVVRVFVESEHSRMPVYRETLDDPVGVVHIKDVMKLIAPDPSRPAPEWSAPEWSEPVLYRIRRDVLYVPASMRAADLMLKMQASRIHMALVIDEFGGTDGLVTLEDLVESVVGEIEDEHDALEAAPIVERPGGVIEADARAPLEDLESAIGESLADPDMDEDLDTVGGLVSALAGRVPQRGEVIRHTGGWEFEVLDADPRRIKRVRVRRITGPAPPADTGPER